MKDVSISNNDKLTEHPYAEYIVSMRIQDIHTYFLNNGSIFKNTYPQLPENGLKVDKGLI